MNKLFNKNFSKKNKTTHSCETVNNIKNDMRYGIMVDIKLKKEIKSQQSFTRDKVVNSVFIIERCYSCFSHLTKGNKTVGISVNNLVKLQVLKKTLYNKRI